MCRVRISQGVLQSLDGFIREQVYHTEDIDPLVEKESAGGHGDAGVVEVFDRGVCGAIPVLAGLHFVQAQGSHIPIFGTGLRQSGLWSLMIPCFTLAIGALETLLPDLAEELLKGRYTSVLCLKELVGTDQEVVGHHLARLYSVFSKIRTKDWWFYGQIVSAVNIRQASVAIY